VTVANWQRAIGALRRLHGSDLAERAGRIAEAAPEADRQFNQEALVNALRSPNVGVGPGRAYRTYHPFNNFEDSLSDSGVTSEQNIENLRRLLQRPGFTGFDEVPWMSYDRLGDQLSLTSQEGRHRSTAIGQSPTIVGIHPYTDVSAPSIEQLNRLPVVEGNFPGARRMPPFGRSYRLFSGAAGAAGVGDRLREEMPPEMPEQRARGGAVRRGYG
jgi:hypothetical protein